MRHVASRGYEVHQADTGGRNKAIIAYVGQTTPDATAALRDALGVDKSFDEVTRKKYEGLLERKWTSVVRLQKKVSPRFPPLTRH